MLSSFSLIACARLFIFRLMDASSGEAESAISSSLIIELKMLLSSDLFGMSDAKYTSRTLWAPGCEKRHSDRERITLKTSPTSSSSRIVSAPPAAALASEELTFFIAPNEGLPNFASRTYAASV